MSNKIEAKVTAVTFNRDKSARIRAATHVKIPGMVKKKKNPAAVSLGALGGKARARKLSKEQLSKEGRKAALTRWAKEKNETE